MEPKRTNLFCDVFVNLQSSSGLGGPAEPPPTHPVDEDVSWQRGVGLLQAAEAVHHPAVVEGQRDLRQTASCAAKQRHVTAGSSRRCRATAGRAQNVATEPAWHERIEHLMSCC